MPTTDHDPFVFSPLGERVSFGEEVGMRDLG